MIFLGFHFPFGGLSREEREISAARQHFEFVILH